MCKLNPVGLPPEAKSCELPTAYFANTPNSSIMRTKSGNESDRIFFMTLAR